MAYIKSKSNYTLQTNHKTIDGNTKIVERDLATIGGLVRVPTSQIPIYQSGNFILTISQPNRIQREFAASEWVGDGDNNFWTLESKPISSSNGEDTTQIVLKRDYYKLSDFSYYGSCSELIRSSINHIISIFPGEIYKTSMGAVYQKEALHATDESVYEKISGYYILDNPFDIDIHTQYIDSTIKQDNELRYFANNGWTKYDVIVTDNNGTNVYSIENWTVNGYDDKVLCIGEISKSEIVITYHAGDSITIHRLRVSYDKYDYIISDDCKFNFSIRPRQKYLNEFYSQLDNFEKILLDKDTTPKYTAIFEILEETEQGYRTSLQKFTFPTAIGGYNLSVGQSLTNGYVDSLVQASASYDDLYCDNLWRSMTHEAIKNFDWTFTKEIEDPSEFIEGGDKIQKLIRVIGREFDEIKSYIDGITAFNTLTYDDMRNAPDYVLSDLVELGGVEVKNIYPFQFSVDGNMLKNVVEDTTNTVQPYTTSVTHQNATTQCSYHTFRTYSSITEFSSKEVNNYFLKTLKMNVGDILKRKGTIEGIEVLLSLFGLKSKRWVDSLSPNVKKDADIKWDFDVNEYTVLTSHLVDEDSAWDALNQKKTATYDTLAFRSGIYEPYQGLPIKAYYHEEENGPILYPYFSKNKQLDGNTYYQMYGGWLRKVGVQYDKNNLIIDEGNNNLWFTQTINRMRVVDNLEELFALKSTEIENGDVWKVANLNGNYLIVDGTLLPIYTDSRVPIQGNRTNEYIKAKVNANGSLIVGKTVFKGNVSVSDSYKGVEVNWGNGNFYMNKHNISLYTPNTEIRIYLINLADGNKSIICHDDTRSIDNVFYWNSLNRSNGYSHYFLLHDKQYKDYLDSKYGWEQLPINDEKPRKYNAIIENYNGNNPHASLTNGVYDDGFTYIERLAKPFDYPLNHNMFSDVTDVWPNFFAYYTKLEEAVFGHMIVDGESAPSCTDCIGSYWLTNDKKIHAFGDYYKSSTNSYVPFPITIDSGLTTWFNEYTETSDESLKKIEYNQLKNDDGWRNEIYGFSSYTSSVTFKDAQYTYTEQIINTKRVNIDFRIPYTQENEKKHYFTKYINDVILPYLEQVLPSTIIVHINYRYAQRD